MKALEKDRNRRYESATALAADVERYLNNEAVEACPPSKAYKLHKYAHRNKAVLVTATLVVASLLTGTGVSAWQAIEANHQRQEAVHGRQEAQDQREVALLEREVADRERNSAVQQRKLALSNQYNAEIVSGQTDWERENIGSLHRKLLGHLPVQGEEDRRGWEWYYLLSLCHPEERTLFHRHTLLFASWSPDGEYIATAGSIWNARSGACVRRFSTSRILRHQVAWSPDGQKFAWGLVSDDDSVYIWDRATDSVSSLRGHESSVWCLAWSPDGTQLASGSMDNTVRIWDVAQGSTVRTLPTDRRVTDVAWSSDGDLLAAVVWKIGLKIWNPSTGEIVVDGKESYGDRPKISWHPDGSQLAVCTSENWSLLQRSDWSVIREQDHPTLDGHDIAWNPDGTLLAVAHGEVVTIRDPAGEQPQTTLLGHLRPVNSVAWSPDGARLVTSDEIEEIKIWDWKAPGQPPPIPTGGPLESLAWLADGQTLVTVSAEDHSASFWGVTAGDRIKVDRPKGDNADIWSPDRRLWAVRVGTDEEPEFRIVDASTSAVHSVWQGRAQHRLHDIDWSPDATMLAIETSFDGYVELEFWDVDHEQTVSRWQKEQHHYQDTLGQIQWSDDGARVGIRARGDVGDNGSVAHKSHAHIVDVATGKRLLKHKLGAFRHQGQATALAWSPGGDVLACEGSEGGVDLLKVDSGRVLVSSKPHNAPIDAITWNPDGQRLASASRDGTVKVLGANDGAELLTFSLDEDTPTRLAWSADGRRLATATESGVIHVWDAGGGYEFSEEGSRHDELAWAYYQRALAHEGRVDRPALHEFLRLVPDTLAYWESRGHANALLNEFRIASEEFGKAIGPDMQLSYEPAWHHAFSLLGAGELEGYRDACASLVKNFSDSDVPSNQSLMAWLCAVSPNPTTDSNTILNTARALHDYETTEDFQDDQILTIGASLFRNEQYDEAISTLTELADKLQRGGDETDRYELACAQYFVAMARHEQRHEVQARRYLAEANAAADAYRQLGHNWRSLVALDALQRETEAALGAH